MKTLMHLRYKTGIRSPASRIGVLQIPTKTPTPTPSFTPSSTITPTPTLTITPTPTQTVTPSITPSLTPSITPSASPILPLIVMTTTLAEGEPLDGYIRTTTGYVKMMSDWDGSAVVHGNGTPGAIIYWSRVKTTFRPSNAMLYSCDTSGQAAGSILEFDCFGRNLAAITLSQCRDLQFIYIPNNQLLYLDLSQCSNLMDAYLSNNQLTYLDLSNNIYLESIDCSGNLLTDINMSGCANLAYANLYFNSLTSLNLIGNSNLYYLTCDANNLTDINIDSSIDLSYLTCSSNFLKTVPLEYFPSLIALDTHSNPLTGLDFTYNPIIEYIWCFDNNPGLHILDQQDAMILTLPKLSALREIDCSYDGFKHGLDFSSFPALRDLSCKGNTLTGINLTNSNLLTGIQISYNAINAAGLEQIYNDLPNLTLQSLTGTINVQQNPGTSTANYTIAEQKNWIVIY